MKDFDTFQEFPGVDILQKQLKNAQGGINSAQAKFPEFPKLSGFTPWKYGYHHIFCSNCRDAEKSVFSNYPNLGYYPNPSENYPNP